MVTVITIGWILAAVTAVLIITLLALHLTALSPATHDFIGRTSLVAIAILPLLFLARGSLPAWQWSLPILPSRISDSVE